jgi:hypothetical protein
MSGAELREMWRAAMSAASGTQRNGARERESPHAALFRPTVVDPGYLLFFPGEEGYELLDAGGPCPAVGDEFGQDGFVFRVLKVGISPFPGDRRRCAYLELDDAPAGLAVEESAGRLASL